MSNLTSSQILNLTVPQVALLDQLTLQRASFDHIELAVDKVLNDPQCDSGLNFGKNLTNPLLLASWDQYNNENGATRSLVIPKVIVHLVNRGADTSVVDNKTGNNALLLHAGPFNTDIVTFLARNSTQETIIHRNKNGMGLLDKAVFSKVPGAVDIALDILARTDYIKQELLTSAFYQTDKADYMERLGAHGEQLRHRKYASFFLELSLVGEEGIQTELKKAAFKHNSQELFQFALDFDESSKDSRDSLVRLAFNNDLKDILDIAIKLYNETQAKLIQCAFKHGLTDIITFKHGLADIITFAFNLDEQSVDSREIFMRFVFENDLDDLKKIAVELFRNSQPEEQVSTKEINELSIKAQKQANVIDQQRNVIDKKDSEINKLNAKLAELERNMASIKALIGFSNPSSNISVGKNIPKPPAINSSNVVKSSVF